MFCWNFLFKLYFNYHAKHSGAAKSAYLNLIYWNINIICVWITNRKRTFWLKLLSLAHLRPPQLQSIQCQGKHWVIESCNNHLSWTTRLRIQMLLQRFYKFWSTDHGLNTCSIWQQRQSKQSAQFQGGDPRSVWQNPLLLVSYGAG